jgi:SAM-dependent methyltransferase
MRATYRSHGGNRDYWQSRWDNTDVDSGALNLDRYPGKYAENTLSLDRPDGPVLEAGCGAGRVLRYYHGHGVDIVGMDFIATILAEIARVDRSIPLFSGDIKALPVPDDTFSAVLAFGLYHGLETGLEKAFAETRRVMKTGGILCASMRLDNFQNKMTDRLAEQRAPNDGETFFHKLNIRPSEFRDVASQAGFEVQKLEYVENMSFLYKYKYLRHSRHRQFNEKIARAEGNLLSPFGNLIQRTSMTLVPSHMSNVGVLTARAV